MRLFRTSQQQGEDAQGSQRGSALIVAVIVMLMLLMMATTVASIATSRSSHAMEGRSRVAGLLAADSGLGLRLEEIRASAGVDMAATKVYTLPDATITVNIFDLGKNGIDEPNSPKGVDDAKEKGVVRLVSTSVSTGQGEPVTRTIEAYARSTFHPLFYKALYVGNKYGVTGYGLSLGPGASGLRTPVKGTQNAAEVAPGKANGSGTTTGGTTQTNGIEIAKSPHTTEADFLDGDAYVNGNLDFRGTTNAYGDIDVTGVAGGRPVTGTTTESATPIDPPDLAAMDYQNLADWVVDVTDPTAYVKGSSNATNYVTGVNNDADGDGLGLPSFIKYGPLTTATDHFHQTSPKNFSFDNFHWGANGGGTIDFASVKGADGVLGTADDRRLYFVKGNLWVDTRGITEHLFTNPKGGEKTQITVVVEGNLFLSDELSYQGGDDAVLFIVKGADDDAGTAGREDESFVDGSGATDPNGVFDADEQIINDNGNATYDGPKEGQGNVYFGELVATEGGITDGYFYAQNNVYLMPLPGKSTEATRVYGVTGFMSAGGTMDLRNRGAGAGFVNYRTKYDDRLEKGTVDLPGVPAAQGGGYAGLQVFTWRELPPNSK